MYRTIRKARLKMNRKTFEPLCTGSPLCLPIRIIKKSISCSTIEHDIDFLDRKSTRLNSSHQIISYAVFCLKKKKTAFTPSPSPPSLPPTSHPPTPDPPS